jgi:hypothetical protein
MHVSFIIHYKNNLIDKKDSYLISCPPSWDDRNYRYGHQLYPSEYIYFKNILSEKSQITTEKCISKRKFDLKKIAKLTVS